MLNKLHVLSLGLGFVIGSLLFSNPAQAVPYFIDTPDHGTCYFTGQNQYHYIYECQDGAIIYISKNPGGSGGGNGGGGNDNCIICE